MRRAARVAPAVITIALLALLWVQLKPGALIDALRGLTPARVALGFALVAAVNVVRAVRFGVLLPDRGRPHDGRGARWRARLGALVPLTFAVSLLGNTLPVRGSDVSFVVLSRTHLGVPAAEATAALAVARLFDLVAVACWFLPVAYVALPRLPATTDVPYPGTPTAAWLLLASTVVVVATTGLLAIVAFSRSGAGHAGELSVRLGADRWGLARRIVGFATDTAAALGGLRNARRLTWALALSLAAWLLTFVWLYAFATALGGPAGFRLFLVGATFGTLAKAIPAPTLGGHGVSETGWALGMTLVGWPPDLAIATGLGVSLLNLGAVAALGLPGLFFLERRRRRATPAIGQAA